MTCVVAIVDSSNNIHMGSDSLASDSHSQTIMTDSKLFMIGELLVGFAGSFRSAQVLQYQMFLPERGELQEDMEYLVASFIPVLRTVFADNGLGDDILGSDGFDGEFLLGYRGQVYKMQNDFSLIVAKDDFVSIGAGGEVSSAVLYATKDMDIAPTDRLELALKSSAYQITTVKEPFHFICVDSDGEIVDNVE